MQLLVSEEDTHCKILIAFDRSPAINSYVIDNNHTLLIKIEQNVRNKSFTRRYKFTRVLVLSFDSFARKNLPVKIRFRNLHEIRK